MVSFFHRNYANGSTFLATLGLGWLGDFSPCIIIILYIHTNVNNFFKKFFIFKQASERGSVSTVDDHKENGDLIAAVPSRTYLILNVWIEE